MTDPLLNLALVGLALALGLWLFWPERGLFWRWRRACHLTQRVLIEDALKHIHDCEFWGRTPTVPSIAGVLNRPVAEITTLTAEMQSRGLLDFDGDRLSLTPAGHDYARQIVRAHRLWERYLADKTGYGQTEWHSYSEQREHELSPADVDALASTLGHPRYDPHGDPIPTADGHLTAPKLTPLPTFPLNKPGRIVHLEDEPEAVYAQLVAEGIHLDMRVLVTEITPQRVRFWTNGHEHVLAPIVAANISVTPVERTEPVTPGPFEPLSGLKPGQLAQVVSISPASRGLERRRLLDLGLVPGTMVKAEFVSPSGDPTAYRIRGALIGLRKEQADEINVSRPEEIN